MITLRDARIALGISYHSLEKYMRQLAITPSRHPVDLRYFTLDDEQLAKLREHVAQKRALQNASAHAQQPQGVRVTPVDEQVHVASSESPLSASHGTPQSSTHGGILSLELLPPDWIAFHTGFCRDHGGLDPRSFARYDFPVPHESEWRSRSRQPQRILKAYDREQHIAASRLAARRWPHKFKACDTCLPHLMLDE